MVPEPNETDQRNYRNYCKKAVLSTQYTKCRAIICPVNNAEKAFNHRHLKFSL